jgi:hypothetical protein
MHDEKLRNLYSSPNVTRIIISVRLRMEHVAHIGCEMYSTYEGKKLEDVRLEFFFYSR